MKVKSASGVEPMQQANFPPIVLLEMPDSVSTRFFFFFFEIQIDSLKS